MDSLASYFISHQEELFPSLHSQFISTISFYNGIPDSENKDSPGIAGETGIVIVLKSDHYSVHSVESSDFFIS